MEEARRRTVTLMDRAELPENVTYSVTEGYWEDKTPYTRVTLHHMCEDASRDGDIGRTPVVKGPCDTYSVHFFLNFNPWVPEEQFFDRLLELICFMQVHEAHEQFRVDEKMYRDPHRQRPIIEMPNVR